MRKLSHRILVLLVLAAAAIGAAVSPAPAAEVSPATQPAVSALEAQLVFPGSRSQGQPETVVQPPAGCELVTLHAADGTKIAAMFSKATTPRSAGPRPALLFFYGNGMNMADSLDVFNQFRGLGFNAIMADYEGYGMSDGKPTEPGCYAAADAAYDYLLTRVEVDHKRIVATGWSLGAAVATDLAQRRPVAGLATFSAFTDTDHIRQRLPKDLAAATPLVSRFDNLTKIGSVSCRIFMVHGADDTLVPIEMLDSLAKAAKSKVTVLRLEGTGHNDLFERGGDPLYQRVKAFVNSLPDGAPTTRP